MLIQKKRLALSTDAQSFMHLMLTARQIEIISTSIEIADLSTKLATDHLDPADRIIAATSIITKADLITCDKKLQRIKNLSVVW